MTDMTQIEQPDGEKIRKDYLPVIKAAHAIIINNQERHAEAGEMLVACAGAEKKVREKLDPIIDTAYRTHKGLTTMRADLLAPITAARSEVSRKMGTYEEEQK